uniref:Uncharacterized protein n=1 Tax=Solanum tuberosum TaxID=4113 RepID=M1CM26_SOLTU
MGGVSSCRRQLIDRRGIELIYQKLNSFKEVRIVGFQVATWIFLNFLPTAMSVMDKILGDVKFNESFYDNILKNDIVCFPLIISMTIVIPLLNL